MKVVRIHQFGGPEVMQYEEAPDPVPGLGQAVVDIQAAGINYADVNGRRAGDASALPITLGREAGGVVSAVGEGVNEVAVGDRVGFSSVQGSCASAQQTASSSSQMASMPAPRQQPSCRA